MICAVYLARPAQLRPGHAGLLDPAERTRAAAYHRDADRDRFVLGAALLRVAAGRQLGVRPDAVRVDRACQDCGRQHGRPVLAGTVLADTVLADTVLADTGLADTVLADTVLADTVLADSARAGAAVHVSVSHSGDVVAVALTRAGPVGVDVEAAADLDYRSLLPYVCTPAEQPHVRCAADFYAYWTRKEAVLKATGEGLRRPMTELTVSPPGTEPVLRTLAGRPAPPCQLASVPAGPGYLAAVAVLAGGPVEVAVRDAGEVLDGSA